MATTIGSGKTTISGNVAVTVTGSTYRPMKYLYSGAGTLGTVPALKVWRIHAITLNVSANSGTQSSVGGSIALNGVTVLYVPVEKNTATVSTGSASLNLGDAYIEIAAGQTVVVTNSSASQVSATIVYEEV